MFQDTQPAALGHDGSLDTWAEFRVDDPVQRLQLLKQLRDGSVPVSLSTARGDAVNAQLWSLDPQRGQMSFSDDGGGVPLQRLAQCGQAVAVAYLDSLKLQFELRDMVLLRGVDACALRAALPHTMYRFQRRSSFRLRSFGRRAPQALLRHPSLPDMQLRLCIVDLSVGGCALSLPDDTPALQPGNDLRGVRIELDGDCAFQATLRLLHVSAMPGRGDGVRLGCEFLELDGAAQRSLQRYIDQMQQRRRLLVLR